MSKVTEKYKIEKDNQYVFLNSLKLKGVQNVSASYQKNLSLADYFGNNEIIQLPNEEPNGQCSINSLYITSDPYIQYTGDIGTSFSILRSVGSYENNFSFTSGFMVSYSQQCGIGEIPSISTTWNSYGDIGGLSTGENINLSTITSGDYLELSQNIVGYNGIGISIDDFTTNRVMQYSLSIQCPRNPKYVVGQIRPRYVLQTTPIQIDISFEYEIDNYELDSLRQDPCNPTSKNITITAKNYQTKNTILSYSFSDMKLISEDYSSNTESYVTVSANYRTFLN